jgi:hypothetical protein
MTRAGAPWRAGAAAGRRPRGDVEAGINLHRMDDTDVRARGVELKRARA